MKFYVIDPTGWHLFGIAHMKVAFIPLQKMYVMSKLEELALNYTFCTMCHLFILATSACQSSSGICQDNQVKFLFQKSLKFYFGAMFSQIIDRTQRFPLAANFWNTLYWSAPISFTYCAGEKLSLFVPITLKLYLSIFKKLLYLH